MSHLQGQQDPADQIGNLYGLRTWIEYGFEQCKDQLGWADYRVTHYPQIERGWEIVASAYLMVSLQLRGLGAQPVTLLDDDQLNLLTRFRQHRYWNEPQAWKRRLNNVQLLIAPFICFCAIEPWLAVFHILGCRLFGDCNSYWKPNLSASSRILLPCTACLRDRVLFVAPSLPRLTARLRCHGCKLLVSFAQLAI